MANTNALAQRALDRLGAIGIKFWDYGQAFHVMLDLEGIAADTDYVLIDLSDTTNYPHDVATAIILKRIHIDLETESSGVYDILVGVVKENDATDGSVAWVARFQLESGDPDRLSFNLEWPSGLNCKIASDAPVYFLTGANEDDNVKWKNDATFISPLDDDGDEQVCAAGDIVLRIEEVSGTGTVDLFAEAEYDAL